MNFSEFEKIPFSIRVKCAVCDQDLGYPTIKLPNYPLTEILVTSKPDKGVGFVNQNFHLCKLCGHGQLSSMLDSSVLYAESYSFRTTASASGMQGNDVFFEYIKKNIRNRYFKTIVEVGCNDLYLLNKLKNYGDKLVGIDPLLKRDDIVIPDSKISIIGDYIEDVDLGRLLCSGDTLFISSHNIEHIEYPRSMMKRILQSSSDNSLFIFQFPSLEMLIEQSDFGQIFHHHLNYFSLQSFEYLVNDLGAELIDYTYNPKHWGSLLTIFRKENNKEVFLKKYSKLIDEKIFVEKYNIFRDGMSLVNRYLKTSIYPLYAYGAALTLPILAYHLQNNFSKFVAIIDDDGGKDGLYYLNLPVPIIYSSKINEDLKQAAVLISATNFSRIIINKLIGLNPKQIIIPVNIV